MCLSMITDKYPNQTNNKKFNWILMMWPRTHINNVQCNLMYTIMVYKSEFSGQSLM